jgi:hypothetical protein
VYILEVKPFKEKRHAFIEVFNELCFLASSYFVLAFSDINSEVGKRKFGWAFYGLIIGMIIFNYALNIQELISKKIEAKKQAAYKKKRVENAKQRLINAKVQKEKAIKAQKGPTEK